MALVLRTCLLMQEMKETCSISVSGRSLWEWNGNPLQYSFLENSMNRGAWQAIVHEVARVKQDLVIQLPPSNQLKYHWLSPLQGKDQQGHTIRSITHSGLLNSFLENSVDRGAWQAIVHEVAKSQTQLSNNNYDISFHIVNSLVSWSQGSMWFSPLFSQLLALVWVVAGTSKVLVGG